METYIYSFILYFTFIYSTNSTLNFICHVPEYMICDVGLLALKLAMLHVLPNVPCITLHHMFFVFLAIV
jgi:hypothetical protein